MTFTLKELRARKGVNQAEVATDLGVSPNTIIAWERDLSNVAIINLYKLAEYYSVSIGEIKLKR